jgi:hypothetical protein
MGQDVKKEKARSCVEVCQPRELVETLPDTTLCWLSRIFMFWANASFGCAYWHRAEDAPFSVCCLCSLTTDTRVSVAVACCCVRFRFSTSKSNGCCAHRSGPPLSGGVILFPITCLSPGFETGKLTMLLIGLAVKSRGRGFPTHDSCQPAWVSALLVVGQFESNKPAISQVTRCYCCQMRPCCQHYGNH